ncbi:MAG: DUF2207 domain-containing protein [Planctomycetota bacterium]|jgi:hypothetical protein
MRRSGYDISISLIVCFFLCASANAQPHAFTWTYIDVYIEVQENIDLFISERQEYSFKAEPGEKRHELSRPFLTDRIDDIQDVEVYELTGNGKTSSEPLALEHRVERDQNDLRICWSGEPNPPEMRTSLLKYRIIGGIGLGRSASFSRRRYRSTSRRRYRRASLDELYWNAVTWPRPAVVEKVKVTVHLPSRLRGKDRRIASRGVGAAIAPRTNPDIVEFNSTHPIPPETGLQIHVGFQHGILKIKRPNWQSKQSSRWKMPPKSIMMMTAVFGAIGVVVDYFRKKCPYCGKMWGLRYTGERENLNAGKIYWFLEDNIWLYKCNACDYKEWKRRGSRGG